MNCGSRRGKDWQLRRHRQTRHKFVARNQRQRRRTDLKDSRPTHTRGARRQRERGRDEVPVAAVRNRERFACAYGRAGLIRDDSVNVPESADATP